MFTSFFAGKSLFSSGSTVFFSTAATSLFSRAMYSSCSSNDDGSNNTTSSAFCSENYNSSNFNNSPISAETIRSGNNWQVPWDTEWDAATVKPTAGADRSIKRQLILIRHGQYQNEANKTCGDSEKTLTEKGVLQAQLTGAFLRKAILLTSDDSRGELFAANSMRSFTSSNLTRAMQTCEEIIDHSDPGMKKWWTIDPLLAERFPCDPAPPYPKKAKEECHNIVEKAFKKYVHRPKAGNTENSVEVIVCHANIIRYFLCRSLQMPPEAWLRLSLPHCSITSVAIRGNGNVSVNQVGGVTHLPVSLQTISNV